MNIEPKYGYAILKIEAEIPQNTMIGQFMTFTTYNAKSGVVVKSNYASVLIGAKVLYKPGAGYPVKMGEDGAYLLIHTSDIIAVVTE